MKTDHTIMISIETTNDAFQDQGEQDSQEEREIAKQLRHIARAFSDGSAFTWHGKDSLSMHPVLDTNGNTCGTVRIKNIR